MKVEASEASMMSGVVVSMASEMVVSVASVTVVPVVAATGDRPILLSTNNLWGGKMKEGG
jgi:hypothetical protein